MSVGPVLAEVRDGLGMSSVTAGLLTSLPVLAFAVFGALAPWLAATVGVHRVTLGALLAVVVGLGGRALVGSSLPFLALSMLALAGMATANVLLPSLVKLHFPDRVGRVTALYTTALAIGLTAVAGPHRADLRGRRWRRRLALGPRHLGRRSRSSPPSPGSVWSPTTSTPARPAPACACSTSDAPASASRWRCSSGCSRSRRTPSSAGSRRCGATTASPPRSPGCCSAWWRAISIPLSLWLPAAAARADDQRMILTVVMACYPLGYVGLLVAPHTLAVPCAILVGIGACTFPLILTMIGLRSRTPAGTAALSGFTQSAGYLLAAVGPFAVGAIYEHTGGWTWPLVLLLVLTLPQILLGRYAARPTYIEDQLPLPATPVTPAATEVSASGPGAVLRADARSCAPIRAVVAHRARSTLRAQRVRFWRKNRHRGAQERHLVAQQARGGPRRALRAQERAAGWVRGRSRRTSRRRRRSSRRSRW